MDDWPIDPSQAPSLHDAALHHLNPEAWFELPSLVDWTVYYIITRLVHLVVRVLAQQGAAPITDWRRARDERCNVYAVEHVLTCDRRFSDACAFRASNLAMCRFIA
eukprot:3000606-Pyramimonas_sp.AAC.1